MNKDEIIEQAISLLQEIEWLGFQENHTCIYCGRNKANGHWQECRYAKALALLESAKVEQPPAGEFTKSIRAWIELLDEAIKPDAVKKRFLEACDCLDAQQQENKKLTNRLHVEKTCYEGKSRIASELADDYGEARNKIDYLTAENKAFAERNEKLERILLVCTTIIIKLQKEER